MRVSNVKSAPENKSCIIIVYNSNDEKIVCKVLKKLQRRYKDITFIKDAYNKSEAEEYNKHYSPSRIVLVFLSSVDTELEHLQNIIYEAENNKRAIIILLNNMDLPDEIKSDNPNYTYLHGLNVPKISQVIDKLITPIKEPIEKSKITEKPIGSDEPNHKALTENRGMSSIPFYKRHPFRFSACVFLVIVIISLCFHLLNISPAEPTGMICSGWAHTLLIDKNNRLMVFGNNCKGQLGLNTYGGEWHEFDDGIDYNTPQINNSLSDIIAFDAGEQHSLFLVSDGTVYGVGSNAFGQLGNGKCGGDVYEFYDGIDSCLPIKIQDISDAIAVSCGHYASFVICSDGTLWSFGHNDYGVLGNGKCNDEAYVISLKIDSLFPQKVAGIQNVIQVSAGMDHVIAVTSNDRVYTWGYNCYGQVGKDADEIQTTPYLVMGLEDIVDISAISDKGSIALKADGTVWAWGRYTILGNGSLDDSSVPVQVFINEKVIDIAAVGNSALALLSDGTVVSWGENYSGELGNGTTAACAIPMKIEGFGGKKIIRLIDSNVGYSAFAVAEDGSVWCWGDNWSGQLGLGTANGKYYNAIDISTDVLVPTLLPNITI